jgi:hypothetical protein
MDRFRHLYPSPNPRLSALLAHSCLLLSAVLPLATLYGLWTTPPVPVPAELWRAAALLAIAMLPVCGMAYGLLRARQCFQGFVRGDIFHLSTARHLRGFAAGMLVAAVAGLLAAPCMGLLQAWSASAGGHALTVELSSQHMLLLLFAGIVWQIAHGMAQAAALADEHAQIV